MSIDKIMMVGVNDVPKSDFAFDGFKTCETSDDSAIFNLKFEPSSFGGKNYHNDNSTSIFDDWDS